MNFFGLLASNVELQKEEFLRKSALAGIKFTHNSEHRLTRCVWRLIIYAFVVITLLIIANLWDQFNRNATMTVMDLPLQGEPLNFPSVFICPKHVSNARLLPKFVSKIKSEHNLNISEELLGNCIEEYLHFRNRRGLSVEICKEYISIIGNPQVMDELDQILITVPEYIIDCSFKDAAFSCDSSFFGQYTEGGYCFVVNNINVKNMHFDTLFSDDIQLATLHEYDKSWNLQFKLLEMDTPIFIYLKNPTGMLTLKDTAHFITTKGIEMKFKVEENFCCSRVRYLTLRQRKCLFEDERSPYEFLNSQLLRNFYNQDICLSICHVAEFQEHCKCVPGKYKKFFKKLAYPSCNGSDFSCSNSLYAKVKTSNCKYCLKNCNYLEFLLETKKHLQIVPRSNAGRHKSNENNATYLPFIIGLNHWPLLRYKTTIIFGWTELLVSFGGIAGLFVGFSFITFIECIYYFTLRLGCAFYVNKDTVHKSAEKRVNKIPCINLSLLPYKGNTKTATVQTYKY